MNLLQLLRESSAWVSERKWDNKFKLLWASQNSNEASSSEQQVAGRDPFFLFLVLFHLLVLWKQKWREWLVNVKHDSPCYLSGGAIREWKFRALRQRNSRHLLCCPVEQALTIQLLLRVLVSSKYNEKARLAFCCCVESVIYWCNTLFKRKCGGNLNTNRLMLGWPSSWLNEQHLISSKMFTQPTNVSSYRAQFSEVSAVTRLQ